MFSQILYSLIIGPLELFFEVVFAVANRIINNPGLSIITLSLAMNFLVLPLYKRADAMQEEERQIDQKLAPWVKHIKGAFKGDERFMILQTYYRQNNYKPTDALKGSISLLLEIPFFIAAYRFLSNLQILKGVQFGPIADLGAPDAMFVVAGFTVNVLPILMTLINFISASIYMKGFPLKSKIQMYGMAVIFLVFLYDSPAGLVFYWTLNNLFSLVKNIFYKLKNPKKVLAILAAITGIGLVAAGILHPQTSIKREMLVVGLGFVLMIPLVARKLRTMLGVKTESSAGNETISSVDKKSDKLFFAGMIFLAVMVGLFIPSGVIKASPQEFINKSHYVNPAIYVVNSLALAFGTFVVWCGVFYKLATEKGKSIMAYGGWAISVVAIVDFMFFGKDYGTILNTLTFAREIDASMKEQLINLLLIVLVSGGCFVVYKWKRDYIKNVIAIAVLALIIMSGLNISAITSSAKEVKDQIDNGDTGQLTIPLSKNGKNVVVFMLDRAIGQYIPYIMNEKPELKDAFSGFTYYANAISYGGFTNVGTPVLYGGYDYRPEQINTRDNELLVDKHNEALKVLPVLFNENGYKVTVCDPPYAGGYHWTPDLSIYNDYPEINAYRAEGMFNVSDSYENMKANYDRNFFCYSIFKIAPVVLQESLYNNGSYNKADAGVVTADADISKYIGKQTVISPSQAVGVGQAFMDNYYVMDKLADITTVSNGSENTFLIMSNEMTHEPNLLDESTYEPAACVDNTEFDASHLDRFNLDGRILNATNDLDMAHYQVNMAALLKIEKWIKYMKDQGVYDNTRIIIVSDHGRDLYEFDDMQKEMGGDTSDTMFFNAFMLVKDFGDGEFKRSDEFMTLGDVAALATEGVIDNPINPFTGTDLSNTSAKQGKQMILLTNWDTETNNGTKFAGGDWYSVHDNIYDMNNWSYEGPNP